MGKIMRNSLCSCGSGKKFKKCCLPMAQGASRNDYESVCLIVGNGFAIDFIKSNADFSVLNPSMPLTSFNNKDFNYNAFLDKIPSVRDLLLTPSHEDHFEAIRCYVEQEGRELVKDCELRRFLGLAYSLFYLELEKSFTNLRKWKWYRWLSYNINKVNIAISFNYDLLLEDTITQTGHPVYRVGCINERVGIPVVKPHGSIDFEISDGFIGGTFDKWQIHTSLNDCNGFVKSISKEKWLEPRLEADIIPPFQENYQYKLGWVQKGDILFDERAKQFDAIVIIGFSYSEADRKEFNNYLMRLPKDKKLYVYNINPTPSLELKNFIESQGHRMIEVVDDIPW